MSDVIFGIKEFSALLVIGNYAISTTSLKLILGFSSASTAFANGYVRRSG